LLGGIVLSRRLPRKGSREIVQNFFPDYPQSSATILPCESLKS
jgi:hypothetical protein